MPACSERDSMDPRKNVDSGPFHQSDESMKHQPSNQEQRKAKSGRKNQKKASSRAPSQPHVAKMDPLPTSRGKPKSTKQWRKKAPANKQNKDPQNGAGKLQHQQQKAAEEGKKKEKKAPRPKIVCVVEEALIRHVKEKRASSRDKEEGEELSDVPKEQINDLPLLSYQDTKQPTIVVSNAGESDKAVSEIRSELSNTHALNATDSFHYLGFDTETRPKYNKGGQNNAPALIQLATPTRAYLFRISYDGMNQNDNAMTESLKQLLCDSTIMKVGIACHNDVFELNRVHGNCCGDGTSYLDLTSLAKTRWPTLRKCGLRNLTATVMRQKLSKAQQMKNWEMKKLSKQMEKYAATDALVALDLLSAIVS